MSKRKFRKFMRYVIAVIWLTPVTVAVVFGMKIHYMEKGQSMTKAAEAAPAPIQLIEVKGEPKNYAKNTGRYAILDKIAACESGNDYGAMSDTASAYGKYQIVWKTWNEVAAVTGKTDKTNPEHQEINARALLDLRGTAPWNASKGCWSK